MLTAALQSRASAHLCVLIKMFLLRVSAEVPAAASTALGEVSGAAGFSHRLGSQEPFITVGLLVCHGLGTWVR